MSTRVILRPHAPLMWALVGIIAGYGLAESYPTIVRANVISLVALAIICGVGAVLAMRAKKWRVRLYATLAIAALAAGSYSLRQAHPSLPTYAPPPQEAQLVIRIDQRFALREESGRVAGIGRIIESPQMPSIVGQRVNYNLRWGLEKPMERGAHIRAWGVLAPNSRGNNEKKGFAQYLERSHVWWSLGQGKALAIERQAPLVMQWVEALRRGAINVLQWRWRGQEDSHGILPSMVIGAKAELSKEQQQNMVRSGTMHLVAVSGMNVMVVAAVLWALLKLMPLPRIVQAAGVVGLLALYALVAGGGGSVWRAWAMVALALGAWGLRRQMNLWATVVLAMVGSLIIEPLSLWNAGWRLSFGVVSGLVLGMGALERLRDELREQGIILGAPPVVMYARKGWRAVGMWVQRGWYSMVGAIGHAMMVSIVSGISVAPMTAAYWGLAQPLGWVLNTLAVAIGSAVTLLGSLSWLLAWVRPLAELVNEVAYGLLGLLDSAIRMYLGLPGGVIEVSPAPGLEAWGTLAILTTLYIIARWVGPRRSY